MESIKQLEIPGGWTTREIRVDDRVFDLVLPADADEYLENVCDDEAVDPYWAALWSAAIPTAELILRASWDAGAKALELGSGIGLVGIAGLAAGLNVTFSDHEPISLQLCAENARRNGFPDADTLLLDWRDPIDSQFPFVFASDILYARESHQPILDTLDQMLATGGECWIGDPGRYHSHEFLQQAADRGYRMRINDVNGNRIESPASGQFQLIILRKEPRLITTHKREREVSTCH